MEYKVLARGGALPSGENYPKRLLDRLGPEAPRTLYFSGPLKFLERFTLAVLSADDIGGLAMMAANDVLFTVREYEMNYLGPSHSVMETEIFRLGLYRKNTTVTLSSAKGLAAESFDSFLLDRFYPPLHEFPEREEYFRRAREGELLMLSVTEPNETRSLPKNVLYRNLVGAALADVVFVPYAHKGSKTLSVARKILKLSIPVFTTEHEINKELHDLGVPGFNRKSVGPFLEKLGARLPAALSAVHEKTAPYISSDPSPAFSTKQKELDI